MTTSQPNLQDLPKNPIQQGYGYTNNPGLPIQGKVVTIPQNLLEGTQYLLATNPSNTPHSLTYHIGNLQATLNNTTEILVWLATHQLSSLKKEGNNNCDTLKNLLEQNLTKTIEILEQNRQNIKQDLIIIEDIGKKRYDTLLANQQRIINTLNENINNKQPISELQKDFDKLHLENKDFQNKLETLFENNTKRIISEISEKL
nr:hypothetical protein [Chrysanthemum yellow edge associated virus 1]